MKCRLIAYYLPQFHPIRENDEWWGPGFTEWTNVVNAKPLFRGHVQPRVPANLGFYDLRLHETRVQQAEMARATGVEAFCYYHYWFGNGKQLLERPLKEVVSLHTPDFPFCVCWANHSWGSATWTNVKSTNKMFVEQLYPGEKDNEDHFYTLLDTFKDSRYVKVDGKLLFIIYDAYSFIDVESFIHQWQQLAKKEGLPGFHFVASVPTTTMKSFLEKGRGRKAADKDAKERIDFVLGKGFDAVIADSKYRAELLTGGFLKTGFHSFISKYLKTNRPNIFDQAKINRNMRCPEDVRDNVYPTIFPNWDRTPRSKADSIFVNSTPEVFKDNLIETCERINDKADEHKIVILKSWNEWGEGNYVEPDQQYGTGYLDAIKNVLIDNQEVHE